jgi:hypothetical protein
MCFNTGQSEKRVVSHQRFERRILFSFGMENERRVKASTPARFLARSAGGKAFTPTVILFIALPASENKSDPG